MDANAQAAGVFARIGFGARGIAMSNALAGDVSGNTSPYYNPALAPFTERQSLAASTAFLSLDRELQFLQFASPMKPRAGVAVGLIHAGVSRIDGRDNSGYHTQDYATDEYAFFLAFGTHLARRVTAGIGIQLFRADYLEGLSAVNSIGLDIGLTIKITDDMFIGLIADDLLARYSWDTSSIYGADGKTTSDRFPTRFRLGGAYTLIDGRLLVTAEYESLVSSADYRVREVRLVGIAPREFYFTESLRLQENRFRFGGEYKLMEMFAVRAGVDRLGSGDLAGATPTAGFMVEQPLGNLLVRAEYAFMLAPYRAGSMHFLTLRLFL